MKKMLQVMSFEINKEKEKIEMCRSVLGATVFRKICDDLLKTANSKSSYTKSSKNEQERFIEVEEKKAASFEIGDHVNSHKKNIQSVLPVKTPSPLKLE